MDTALGQYLRSESFKKVAASNNMSDIHIICRICHKTLLNGMCGINIRSLFNLKNSVYPYRLLNPIWYITVGVVEGLVPKLVWKNPVHRRWLNYII